MDGMPAGACALDLCSEALFHAYQPKPGSAATSPVTASRAARRPREKEEPGGPGRRRRPLHAPRREVEEPGEDHGDGEARGQRGQHRRQHPGREVVAPCMHRLAHLEHREGEDPVPHHHPEHPPALQLGEEVAERRLSPGCASWRRAARRLRPKRLLDGRERRQDRGAVAGAPLGRLLQHPIHQVGQPGRPGDVELRRRRRSRRPPSLAFGERVLAREHDVEHHAQGEDVGPLVLRVVLPLLRRHVGRRAAAHTLPPEGVSHPEVEDLHLAPVGDEHVGGLEVPVHDPLGVGVGEPARHLHGDVHRLLDRQRPVVEPLLQGLPVQELEDQVRATIAAPDVVERDQVGVGEPRDRLGLANHPSVLAGRLSPSGRSSGPPPAPAPDRGPGTPRRSRRARPRAGSRSAR